MFCDCEVIVFRWSDKMDFKKFASGAETLFNRAKQVNDCVNYIARFVGVTVWQSISSLDHPSGKRSGGVTILLLNIDSLRTKMTGQTLCKGIVIVMIMDYHDYQG